MRERGTEERAGTDKGAEMGAVAAVVGGEWNGGRDGKGWSPGLQEGARGSGSLRLSQPTDHMHECRSRRRTEAGYRRAALWAIGRQ